MMARAASRAASVPALRAAAAPRTAGRQLAHRQRMADDAGGGDADLLRRAADESGHEFRRGAHVLHALLAACRRSRRRRWRRCALRPSAAQALLCSRGREAGGEAVAREDAGGGSRPVTDDERDVRLALGALDAAAGRSRAGSRRGVRIGAGRGCVSFLRVCSGCCASSRVTGVRRRDATGQPLESGRRYRPAAGRAGGAAPSRAWRYWLGECSSAPALSPRVFCPAVRPGGSAGRRSRGPGPAPAARGAGALAGSRSGCGAGCPPG